MWAVQIAEWRRRHWTIYTITLIFALWFESRLALLLHLLSAIGPSCKGSEQGLGCPRSKCRSLKYQLMCCLMKGSSSMLSSLPGGVHLVRVDQLWLKNHGGQAKYPTSPVDHRWFHSFFPIPTSGKVSYPLAMGCAEAELLLSWSPLLCNLELFKFRWGQRGIC